MSNKYSAEDWLIVLKVKSASDVSELGEKIYNLGWMVSGVSRLQGK